MDSLESDHYVHCYLTLESMSRLKFLYLFLLMVLLSPVTHAAPVPAPPALDASSYLLVDYDSGTALVEHNIDERTEPASITKMMTAYVIYKALAEAQVSKDDQVHISEKAWRMIGSRMFVKVDTRVKFSELLKGLIIQSGNDATVALAEHVAGTEEAFVALMNAEAQALGMTGTHYVNVSGLPDAEHYTTARDIAHLSRALIRNFPDEYAQYAEREYTYNDIKQYNRNKLLWRDPSVDGIKTGHTDAAGYCLVASGKRDNMRLISVVMGAASEKARATQSQALLNYGFRFFETHKLYAAGEPLKEPRIWKGEVDNVPLGLTRDMFVTIPKGQYKALQAGVEFDAPLEAPLDSGQVVGRVKISLNGDAMQEQPLVALHPVAKGGLFSRALDSVLLMFE